MATFESDEAQKAVRDGVSEIERQKAQLADAAAQALSQQKKADATLLLKDSHIERHTGLSVLESSNGCCRELRVTLECALAPRR